MNLPKSLALSFALAASAAAASAAAASAAAASAAAASAAALPDSLARQFEAFRENAPKMDEIAFYARESGGAYLPEIVAPADPDRYQSPEKQRLMAGVYWMDLAYAAAFRQPDPAARFADSLLRLLESLGHPRPDLARRLRESLSGVDPPGGDDAFHSLVREIESDPIWNELLATPEGVEIAADALCGYLLEALHVAVENAVLSDFRPDYLRFVADVRNAFLPFRDLLSAIRDDPDLASLPLSAERLALVASILETVGDLPDVGPDQILALRPVVAAARSRIVGN